MQTKLDLDNYAVENNSNLVPEGWRSVRFGEIAKVNPGKVKCSDDAVVTFIAMADVSEDGKILSQTASTYSAVKSGFTPFQRNDVLIAKITPCFENGKGAFLDCLNSEIGFGSTEFHVLRANNNVLPKFLFYHTRLYEFRGRGEQNMTGSAGQKRVPVNFLETYRILLPPVLAQRDIVHVLSTWDKYIEKLQQLIAAKQKRKKGLMQQLLTGKKRFQEFIKNDEDQVTKFGPYPKDWAYMPLEKVAKEVSIKNKKNIKLPVLSCTKYRGLVDSLEYFGKQIFSKDTSTYKIVKRGQFAYATNHIEEGSIGYQDLYDEALISPMYTAFVTNDKVNDDFLYRLLKTDLYIHIYQASTSASVDRRGSLRWAEFSKIKIALPCLEEQSKISAVLQIADKEIETLQQKLDALKLQKKGLMQKLLTGQVRVNLKLEPIS